jgi:hypothetical protein
MRTRIDEQAPGAAHGVDTDADGNGRIGVPRLISSSGSLVPFAIAISRSNSSMQAPRRLSSPSANWLIEAGRSMAALKTSPPVDLRDGRIYRPG